MKIVFFILAYACLAQETTYGLSTVVRLASNPVRVAVRNTTDTVTSLDTIIKNAIVDANILIDKYTDNSTNYAEEYRKSSSVQIKDLVMKTLNETSPSMTLTTVNLTACLATTSNYTTNITQTTAEDVGRCVITQVRQFRDIAIKLIILANDTANFVPNTEANVKKCDLEANDFFKIACLTRVSAEATGKAAALLINLSITMGQASALFATYQGNINLCAQARILAFRRKLAMIPLITGICAARRIMA